MQLSEVCRYDDLSFAEHPPSVLQVVGGPKDGWSVKCLLEFARLRPNAERRALPCGQGDQSIVDRGVGCRSICQQRDVAGKCSRCRADGIPVVGRLDLNVQRISASSANSMSSTNVCTARHSVEAGNHNLAVAVLGVWDSWRGTVISVDVLGSTLTCTVTVATDLTVELAPGSARVRRAMTGQCR